MTRPKFYACFSGLLSAVTMLLGSCSKNENVNVKEVDNSTYKYASAFPKLSFSSPVDLQNAGDGTNRLFVAEQHGVIREFANDSTTSAKNTFLDITSKVESTGQEQGLLGLAFDPNYESNGYFYVNYTASGPERSVISRFTVSSADQNAADPTSELILLTYLQPFENHNGGQLAFGPDGYLYIAVGDGGGGGDPNGNGQNKSVLLGKILRIDVSKTDGDNHYGIPADNPFAGNTSGYRQEIFAYGLRNPWRFSFDKATGSLWAGDVGQDKYEEVDIIGKGDNCGWNLMEGNHCFLESDCSSSGLKLPVYDYPHSQGISVIGGFVYRGSLLPGLTGHYIFTDYGGKQVWKLSYGEGVNTSVLTLFATDFSVASFGVDEQNEIYLCGMDGTIYTIKKAANSK